LRSRPTLRLAILNISNSFSINICLKTYPLIIIDFARLTVVLRNRSYGVAYKIMKLRARSVLLVVVYFLGLVAGVLAIQHKFDLDRTNNLLLITELKQRKQYYNDLTNLEGSPLKTFSEDYSFGTMVEYAHRRPAVRPRKT